MVYTKLNTNENPFPPSEKAIKYAYEEAKKNQLYSDPLCTKLTEAVCKRLGIEKENVIFTNGSDEALDFSFMAFCDKDHPAYFPDITYGFYTVFADLNAVPYEEIPLKDDFSVDIEDYKNKNGTVFIANPNAPTGLYLPLSKIEELLDQNRERVVVVDEAYIDFGGQSAVSLINKYDNLLVIQTFSKSRSMAGARLGMCIGCRDIISDINTIKFSTNPYNVNRMTMACGVGSVEDDEYFESCCKTIIENRKTTANELYKLGFTMTDSKANFLFVKHEDYDGKQLYLDLKKNGVLVRHFDKPRISEYNRITIGSAEQMKKLIDTIKMLFETKGIKI